MNTFVSEEEKGIVELQFRTVQARLKAMFEKIPDLNAVLFLIGMQETGKVRRKFTKEQKQDLMHVAVCSLLGQEGYYKYKGRDADGWPHFEPAKHLPELSLADQEWLLKKNVVSYFENLQEEFL